MTNKRTSIIEIDQFKGTNLYKHYTRVHFNLLKDEEIIAYRWCDIRGKISTEKARFILDSLFMTEDEYLKEHKAEIEKHLAYEKIDIYENYEDWQMLRNC